MSTGPARPAVVAMLAIATGVVIANLYYAQPVSDALATSFGVPAGAIGVVLTLLQLGYAVGLALLVPLGDLLERRRLLVVMLAVCVLGLVGMAAAPNLIMLEAAAVLVGLTTVVAQIIVPFAAAIAPPGEQGRVVSTVMSGLLIGVLVSRTVAGVLAQFAGWRSVFVLAAVATTIIGVVLFRALPQVPPTAQLSYPRLLGSVLQLVREEPVLRLRMAYGALLFAAFSTFWSSAGFLLARPPYRFSQAEIGLFALLGVAGAVTARVAGRLADQGYARGATAVFLILIAVSFLAMGLGGHRLVLLALGAAVMDLGCQGAHLSNQSVIYRLRPDAQSRVNTAYMTLYFLAGALGSGLSSVVVYPHFGWTGVCVLGGLFPVIGLGVWLVDRLRGIESADRPRPGRRRDRVRA